MSFKDGASLPVFFIFAESQMVQHLLPVQRSLCLLFYYKQAERNVHVELEVCTQSRSEQNQRGLLGTEGENS